MPQEIIIALLIVFVITVIPILYIFGFLGARIVKERYYEEFMLKKVVFRVAHNGEWVYDETFTVTSESDIKEKEKLVREKIKKMNAKY